MTLITLVGVWALVFGQMSLTHNIKMKDNEARMFGAILIALATYGWPYIIHFVSPHIPQFIASNSSLSNALDLAIGGVCIYATAALVRRNLPKIKVPHISFKRLRA
jgi:hypothetical protein